MTILVNMSHFRKFIAKNSSWVAFQALAICLLSQPLGLSAAELLEIKAGGAIYRVEVASTSQQRRQGLMRRASLDRNQGMLLVYQKSADHRIWMRNVLIPLRVYWIDSDARVIDMQRLEPCRQDPCPVYAASGPSRYVLELSDHEHPLEPGDIIDGLRDL